MSNVGWSEPVSFDVYLGKREKIEVSSGVRVAVFAWPTATRVEERTHVDS